MLGDQGTASLLTYGAGLYNHRHMEHLDILGLATNAR